MNKTVVYKLHLFYYQKINITVNVKKCHILGHFRVLTIIIQIPNLN